MIDLIIDFLSCILLVFSSVLFGRLILNKKICKSYISLLIYILLLNILLSLFCYLELFYVKTIISLFIVCIFYYKYYKLDINKAIILTFWFFIVQLISDLCCYRILLLFFNNEFILDNLLAGYISNILVFLVFTIITLIIRNILHKIVDVKYKKRFIFLIIFSILCVIIVFYSSFSKDTILIDKVVGSILLIFMFVYIIYSFIEYGNYYESLKENDKLLEFIKRYEIEIDNQRIRRHEFKNQLLTVKAKIIDGEKNTDIIDYIDIILEDCRKIRKVDYAKLKDLPSNGIRGLFYFKLDLAKDMGLNINIHISKGLENSFFKDIGADNFDKICKVLGIYLDNAIEGANVTNDKKLVVEVYYDDEKVKFIISNSYNKNIKKNGRSTKGSNRGYGLLLANSIIKSNKKLVNEVKLLEDIYITKLYVYK